MGVLTNSKFQLFAGILLVLVVVIVVIVLCVQALRNTFETGETEFAGIDVEKKLLGT